MHGRPEIALEEIFDAYVQSWKLGVKAVAIYRDNSKRTQPLSTSSDAMKAEKKAKKAEMKKLKKQQKQQKKAKKKEMKEKGGTPQDAVQTQGQEMNHSGPDLTPAVPDIPAPQASGAR